MPLRFLNSVDKDKTKFRLTYAVPNPIIERKTIA